jgi:Zn-dependent protease
MTDTTEKKSWWRDNRFTNVLLIVVKFITKIMSVSVKITKIVLAGVSLAAYTYMFSWKFALMIMAQLLIHEYGHIWAMKRTGIKTKGIFFIPFVGGAAVASEDFKSRNDEVFVALMGPVFGFACAGGMLALYYATNNPIYAAGASWMAMINLFNLLPINPLDGGRVMKSIAFSLHTTVGLVFLVLGIIASGFLAFYAHMWIFIFVIILSSLELAIEFYYKRKWKIEDDKIRKHNDELESLRQKYVDEGREIPFYLKNLPIYEYQTEKPNMTKLEIAIALVGYFLLAILLYMFMAATMSVPGAAIAMEFLQ